MYFRYDKLKSNNIKWGLIAEDTEFVDVFSGKEYFYVYPNGDRVDTVIVMYEWWRKFKAWVFFLENLSK